MWDNKINSIALLKGEKTPFLMVLIMLLIFFGTSNTFSYNEAISNGYSDIITYFQIATDGFDKKVGESNTLHRIERWPIHIIVYYVYKITNIEIWSIYRFFIIGILLSCLFVINSINNISQYKKIAIWAMIVFNPFTFRLYYLAPGMISDSLLLLGLLLFVCGLLNKNNAQIIIAIIISLLSRQTALMLIPIIGFLYLNKLLTTKKIILYNIIILFIFIFIKVSTTELFNAEQINYYLHNLSGLILWVNSEFSIHGLFSFFGRYLFFLLTLFPLFFIINNFEKNEWLYLSFFFLIAIQPLAGGPAVTGGSIQRLSAMGLPFLVPIIAFSNCSDKKLIIYTISCILGSFHHQSSFIHTFMYSKFIFLFTVCGNALLFSIFKLKTNDKI